jgi:hypothetical protein
VTKLTWRRDPFLSGTGGRRRAVVPEDQGGGEILVYDEGSWEVRRDGYGVTMGREASAADAEARAVQVHEALHAPLRLAPKVMWEDSENPARHPLVTGLVDVTTGSEVVFAGGVHLVLCQTVAECELAAEMLRRALRERRQEAGAWASSAAVLEHKTQHPNAMRAYVRHFVNDGGQWWIPTVSTTLVDCVPFYNQEDARRRILLWHSSRRPALQNLTADDADRFMSALRTGFQTVSQVLLSKDIW